MGAGPQISQQKILAASRGDSAALLEVLQQVAQVSTQQQAVTGTTPKANAPVKQANPAAPVPPQGTGYASLLEGSYIVQIVPAGGQSQVSSLQAAQAAGNPNAQLTPLQPVQAVFNQVRASTSPAFNVNSNTQTFGGNTGSPQTFWTLTGLGSGTWFIQFRSSYDGINFNQWKNANSGTAGKIINQVTVETPGNSTWAVFELPGSLIVGIGAAELVNGEIFDLAEEVYSSGMVALAGPNGFGGNGNGVSGFANCDVDLVLPPTGTPSVGIPDYPVEINVEMLIANTTSIFPANGDIFAIAFDPTNPAVTLYEEGGANGAVWAVLRLPGGAQIAVGQGQGADGANIWTPAGISWLSGSRMMSICSLTDATGPNNPVTGFNKCQLNGLAIEAQYLDDAGNPVTGQTANWMAVAWQSGVVIDTVGGFPFLTIPLQGGHAVVIGAGQVASGTPVALPSGYTVDNFFGICTPASSANTGHHMRGIQTCAFELLSPVLWYTDNSTNTWSGSVNWMLTAWK